MWTQVKRLGGTSIGAVVGSFLVVGCTVQEIANWMNGPDDYINWVFKGRTTAASKDLTCVGRCSPIYCHSDSPSCTAL